MKRLIFLFIVAVGSSCGYLTQEFNEPGKGITIPKFTKFPPVISAGNVKASSSSFKMEARIGRSIQTTNLNSASFHLKPGVQSKE